MSSSTTFPAVHGPGDFLLHRWHNSDTSLGFRLPLATDFTMHDVTVVIAPWSDNFTLDGTANARRRVGCRSPSPPGRRARSSPAPRGIGALDGNGCTVAASGIGTPVLRADGRTLTLTIDSGVTLRHT